MCIYCSLIQVYCAALKAKLRREEEQRRNKEQKCMAKVDKMSVLARLSSPREVLDWRSEYQKQFPAYGVKEYERSAAARMVIPHAKPLQAVHRGGCMFVQVD